MTKLRMKASRIWIGTTAVQAGFSVWWFLLGHPVLGFFWLGIAGLSAYCTRIIAQSERRRELSDGR